MHVQYYETIFALLDKLSKLYRESFGGELAQKLDELKDQQMNGTNNDNGEDEPTENSTRERSSSTVSAEERNRILF